MPTPQCGFSETDNRCDRKIKASSPIGNLTERHLGWRVTAHQFRQVSRINPKESWNSEEVPHLRIVSDDLWSQVKARQEEIDATPAVKAIKESRFWERRRPRHFLSGLLVCGSCGGGIATMGKTYVACSNARKFGTCDSHKGIRRDRLEALILNLLKESACWSPSRPGPS